MKLSMYTGVLVGTLLLTLQTAQAADQLQDDQSGATMVKTSQSGAAKPASGNVSRLKQQEVNANTMHVLVPNDGKPTLVQVEYTPERADPANQSPKAPPKPRVMELTW